MLSLKNAMLGFTVLSSGVVFAGTMGPIEQDVFKQSAYIKLGSGGSYSMNSNISPNSAYWDVSPQGYDGNIGSTAIYSAAFGYNYSKLISADIEYIYRPSYTYSKYQTSTNASSVNFSGNKTRYFDLQSNSLMANLYLHGQGVSDKMKLDVSRGFSIEPFVGAGIGVAFNTMSNFHSVSVVTPTGASGPVVSMLADNLRTSFAWQLSAGINLYNDTNFNLGAGYRYYNAGTMSSNNYWTDWQLVAEPWKTKMQANEFFVTLAYNVDA
jgi:opacity protein-like surface antigen